LNKPEATELAIAAATFGQRPSAWIRFDDDAGLADEFDRTLAVYYQEWFDRREEHRLKRVLNWLVGGEEKGKTRRECSHERREALSSGELLCLDCGERGN
jgi:hypothetical protein